MVRPPYFDSNGIKKGSWSDDEDQILRDFVLRHGHPPNWRLLPKLAGLPRCGKSCRLRWVNYLKPGVRRGNFSKEEEDLIIKLHSQVGNKWSMIASNFPGRTDNDIKNYWHAHIQKRGRSNGAARKSIMPAQTPQDQSSCDQINSSCITTDDDDHHHQKEESVFDNVFAQGLAVENPGNIDALMNPINGDACLVARGQGGVWSEPYDDQTCFSQLSNIDVLPFKDDAEFHGFGLGQNEMLSIFSDSSDGGITSWNSSSAECDQVGNFWSDELPFGEDSLDIWCFGDDHMNMVWHGAKED